MRRMQALLAVLGLLMAAIANGQGGPVRILVGFPPGGTSDLVARTISERVGAFLGVPVIVENKPGVNGVLAAQALKNAAPDGRTLMISPIAVTVFAPLTNAKLEYDPAKDFAPVSLVAKQQLVLAVGPGSPARTLHEYLDWVRANPARGTFGTPTLGGQPQFLGVMLARAAGLDLTPVPYKGGGQLVNDLIGGQVPAGITVLAELIKHHKSGKVRILASFGTERSPVAPDVPTFRELGFANVEGNGWQAFHVAAGTPRPVIERLSAAIASAVQAPEVRERFLAVGLEPVGSTPDELARRVAEDTARWGPLVKASGLRAD